MTDLLCLTVTRSRPHFMPWLLANFDAIEWPWGRKELIIAVDDKDDEYLRYRRPDVRLYRGFKVSSLGEHRQRALEVACSVARYGAGLHSTWITWMDDDDWRHPLALKNTFQSAKILPHDDELRVIIPRCEHNALIDVDTGRWAENGKQIHWYETLIRADFALELEPFMPVDISEDYYWHQNVVSLAQSKGPTATHTLAYPVGKLDYSSANLFHSRNTACNDFEQVWQLAQEESGYGDTASWLEDDIFDELMSLRVAVQRYRV